MNTVTYITTVKDPEQDNKEIEQPFCFQHAVTRAASAVIQSNVVDAVRPCYDCAKAEAARSKVSEGKEPSKQEERPSVGPSGVGKR